MQAKWQSRYILYNFIDYLELITTVAFPKKEMMMTFLDTSDGRS
jgi:hypothetical protein